MERKERRERVLIADTDMCVCVYRYASLATSNKSSLIDRDFSLMHLLCIYGQLTWLRNQRVEIGIIGGEHESRKSGRT